MELGATICTPRNPKCLLCPVRAHCEAQAAGVQETIPPPKQTKLNPLLRRDVLCIERDGCWLIEQRPPTGRWAGMWQFLTLDRSPLDAQDPHVASFSPLGTLEHALTHRRYEFRVYRGQFTTDTAIPTRKNGAPRKWVALNALDAYPLPRPHLRIAQMLKSSIPRAAVPALQAGPEGPDQPIARTPAPASSRTAGTSARR
jgi:A/G-specific adenine glycosylase